MENSLQRQVMMGKNGALAAGHPLVALAGHRVLSQGGNAVDAAIAMAGVAAVVMPHACSLGGDAFIMVYHAKNNELKLINASGPAPRAARRELFLNKGIPTLGIAASTVPGVVAGWAAALKLFGTMTPGEVLKQGIRYAREGFAVFPRLSQMIGRCVPTHGTYSGWSAVFMPEGKVPEAGEILVQKELARTLESLAQGGLDSFYRGQTAQTLVEFSRKNHGLFEMADLGDYSCRVEEPVHTDYRNYTVFEAGPNSWGFLLLLQLNLLEEFDLISMGHNTPRYVHTMLEARRVAFSEKDRFLADPGRAEAPLAGLLSKNYARKLRLFMDPVHPGARVSYLNPASFSDNDTTYLAVADSQGNLVSLIQSVFMPFGCGQVIEGTGIVMNDRMLGFNLEEGHPNCVEGGKWPAHTLSPAMLFKSGRPFAALGTPGGPAQTQTLAQIAVNLIDFGKNPQEAVEAPRWVYQENGELLLENRAPKETFAELANKGYRITDAGARSELVGSPKAIIIDRDRSIFLAGADPRRDAIALAW